MKKLVCTVVLTMTGLLSLVVMTSSGCDGPVPSGTQDNAGGGGSGGSGIDLHTSPTSAGNAGNSGSAGSPPSGSANCGQQTMNASKQAADVLLVLDRSGSMGDDIAQDCKCLSSSNSSSSACANLTTCKDRWSTVSSAVTATVSSTPDLHWGLKLFSTPAGGNTGRIRGGSSACGMSNEVEVAVGANSANAIQQVIQATSPANNTPTAAAIAAATAYLKTVNEPNNKVILLATDGEPNCAPSGASSGDVDGTVAAITAAKTAGFQVYVIGIGPSVGNLDKFAVAGGTNKYFPATSSKDLADALASISVTVASCSFVLTTVPPDANNVAVYLDKSLLKQDPSNGWGFGATSQTIVLNGDSCDKIKSGKASSVQVLFGCPNTVPPQVIP
jgi:hypothetical protein